MKILPQLGCPTSERKSHNEFSQEELIQHSSLNIQATAALWDYKKDKNSELQCFVLQGFVKISSFDSY